METITQNQIIVRLVELAQTQLGKGLRLFLGWLVVWLLAHTDMGQETASAVAEGVGLALIFAIEFLVFHVRRLNGRTVQEIVNGSVGFELLKEDGHIGPVTCDTLRAILPENGTSAEGLPGNLPTAGGTPLSVALASTKRMVPLLLAAAVLPWMLTGCGLALSGVSLSAERETAGASTTNRVTVSARLRPARDYKAVRAPIKTTKPDSN